MHGNIIKTDTKGAYHVCAFCRKGLVGPVWTWTEAPRQYFCCTEHIQAFAKGEPIPVKERATGDPNASESPGRLKGFWKRLTTKDEDGSDPQ